MWICESTNENSSKGRNHGFGQLETGRLWRRTGTSSGYAAVCFQVQRARELERAYYSLYDMRAQERYSLGIGKLRDAQAAHHWSRSAPSPG
ncbi:hypothetical protein FIBSPDRAFT_865387 [Athelia psychrophila]|uniref:Uncharacterized protein n=1 Tax=Athelia psychrophila TaxID=1759441 RepID=A0A166FQJ9_9AGAM|nr:hypothetical protein FIBSPDRAFT_865387 [Fibularhizoctonia sp. CBS 109695]